MYIHIFYNQIFLTKVTIDKLEKKGIDKYKRKYIHINRNNKLIAFLAKLTLDVKE